MYKILVVEDAVDLRMSIVELLEFANFNVMAVDDGQQGLAASKRFQPDLIITDINMPNMNGFEMLLELRKASTTQGIPCIILTAQDDRASFRYGMAVGADDFLGKPFTSDELLEAIETRLERHKMLREDVHQQVQELQLLRQMDQELSQRLKPNWVIKMIFDWALRQTNANYALLLLRVPERDDLILKDFYGKMQDVDLQLGQQWFSNTIADLVMLAGRSILIPNIEEVSDIQCVSSDTLSTLAVPLEYEESVQGVIILESTKEANFTREAESLLVQMASRASVALQHAELFETLVAQRESEMNLRRLFQSFLSEEVVTAIEEGTINAEGEIRKVTVLFCDIRGFTTFSDQHTASEVVALLNQYFPIVIQSARMHGGNVNKFGGDSVMIVFGAPNPMREPTYHAILTALQIIKALPSLNETLFTDHAYKLQIGVGINTGEVIAGTIGSDDRKEYTVIGDTVNLAARVESLNKIYPQHSIFITDEAYQDLAHRRDEFLMTDMGYVDIRGKANAVQVWAIDDIIYAK